MSFSKGALASSLSREVLDITQFRVGGPALRRPAYHWERTYRSPRGRGERRLIPPFLLVDQLHNLRDEEVVSPGLWNRRVRDFRTSISFAASATFASARDTVSTLPNFSTHKPSSRAGKSLNGWTPAKLQPLTLPPQILTCNSRIPEPN